MEALPFIQLNLHRALTAATHLNSKIGVQPTICMITEPTTAYNKISNVPANHVALPSTTLSTRPRAAILVPRHIPHVFLEQLSNPDAAVALVKMSCGKVLLASIYLDYNDRSVTPDWLSQIVEYAESRVSPRFTPLTATLTSAYMAPLPIRGGKSLRNLSLSTTSKLKTAGNNPPSMRIDTKLALTPASMLHSQMAFSPFNSGMWTRNNIMGRITTLLAGKFRSNWKNYQRSVPGNKPNGTCSKQR